MILLLELQLDFEDEEPDEEESQSEEDDKESDDSGSEGDHFEDAMEKLVISDREDPAVVAA